MKNYEEFEVSTLEEMTHLLSSWGIDVDDKNMQLCDIGTAKYLTLYSAGGDSIEFVFGQSGEAQQLIIRGDDEGLGDVAISCISILMGEFNFGYGNAAENYDEITKIEINFETIYYNTEHQCLCRTATFKLWINLSRPRP